MYTSPARKAIYGWWSDKDQEELKEPNGYSELECDDAVLTVTEWRPYRKTCL